MTDSVLDLSKRGYRAWPIEFMQDDKIQEVDVSLNELRFIDGPKDRRKGKVCGMKMFPKRVEVFKATGNQIERLPEIFSELRHLKHVLISGNRIVDLSPVQSLPHLVQVGAAYNKIQSLPNLLSWKRVLWLDLSFNELFDLEDTLLAIEPCSSLVHLKLKGNPFCLKHGYSNSIRTHLPWLKTIDDIDMMSLDPVEAQTKGQNKDLYTTILELQISQLELSLGDNTVEEGNEISKFYIKFFDSTGHYICSFPLQKGIQGFEPMETKKSKNKDKSESPTLPSGFCKCTWYLNATIAEAKWIQSESAIPPEFIPLYFLPDLHFQLLKQSIKPTELSENNQEKASLEDEVIGDCLFEESVSLLNGQSPQTIEQEVLFTTKYIYPDTTPITIASAHIRLHLRHQSQS